MKKRGKIVNDFYRWSNKTYFDGKYFVSKRGISVQLYHPTLNEEIIFTIWLCELEKNETDINSGILKHTLILSRLKKYDDFDEVEERDLTEELNKYCSNPQQNKYIFLECADRGGNTLPIYYNSLLSPYAWYYTREVLDDIPVKIYDDIRRNQLRLKEFKIIFDIAFQEYTENVSEYMGVLHQLLRVVGSLELRADLLIAFDKGLVELWNYPYNGATEKDYLFENYHITQEEINYVSNKFSPIIKGFLLELLKTYNNILIEKRLLQKCEVCDNFFIYKESKKYCSEKCKIKAKNKRNYQSRLERKMGGGLNFKNFLLD